MRWQAGYTIVEVTLFLAITGLLFMVVMMGLGNSLSNNRYTDTNRSLEAELESVYAGVRSGEAVRPTDVSGRSLPCGAGTAFPGASNDCIVTGRLLRIKKDTDSKIDVFNVVSAIRPDPGCDAVGIKKIVTCYHPQVLDMTTPEDSYSPEWVAQIKNVAFQSAISASSYLTTSFIAILRDPESELVYTVPLDNDDASMTTSPYSLSDGITDSVMDQFTNAKGQMCLQHADGRKSYVQFIGGEGAGTIEALADPLLTSGAATC
jgi:hypothetical protein